MTFQIMGVILGGRIGYAILYQTERVLKIHFLSCGSGRVAWPVTVALLELSWRRFGMLTVKAKLLASC